MATVNGLITVGKLSILDVASDPSAGGGTIGTLNSIALAEDGSGLFVKTAAGDTAWGKVPTLTSGAVPVSQGGTGAAAFTAYSVICAGTAPTSAFQNVSGVGSAGQVLTSNGAAALPTWQSISAGTVTSVSVTTNQGVSGVVATATTTPAITLSLGALTGVTSFNGLIVTANTGAITTGTWNATAIGATKGGTSFTTYATGDTIYASAANTLSKLAIGASGQVLTVSAGVPSWATPTTGTVTSVSVTTNQGVSGVVATATTTPAITLSLGALTGVTSFNGLIVTANTGAITTGTWNATVVGLAYGGTNANIIADNGAIFYSTATAAALLASTATANKMLLSGSSAAPTWSTSTIPSSAGATANKILLSDGTNYVLSTPTFPNASATSGKIIISDGTNWIASTTTEPNSCTTGDLIYASAANTYSNLAGVATGNALISGGVTTAPSWGKIDLTTHITGVLGSSNGGTGVNNGGRTLTIATNNATITNTGGAWNQTYSGSFTYDQNVNTTGTPTFGATIINVAADGTTMLQTRVGGNGRHIFSTAASGAHAQILTGNSVDLRLGSTTASIYINSTNKTTIGVPQTVGDYTKTLMVVGNGGGTTIGDSEVIRIVGSNAAGSVSEIGFIDFSAGTGYKAAATIGAVTVASSTYTTKAIVFSTRTDTASNLAPTERWRIGTSGYLNNLAAEGTSYIDLKAGTASVAPFGLAAGTNLTTATAGKLEYDGTTLSFTNGGAQRQELIQVQQSRVSTQFDKTTSTALANITGLTATLVAGKTYQFEAFLHTTEDAVGGAKFAIAGTCTATNIIYEIQLTDNTSNAMTITSRQTALAGSSGQSGTTSGFCYMTGMITVNAAGTLTCQFAQNASNGTSSILVGSYFIVRQIA